MFALFRSEMLTAAVVLVLVLVFCYAPDTFVISATNAREALHSPLDPPAFASYHKWLIKNGVQINKLRLKVPV